MVAAAAAAAALMPHLMLSHSSRTGVSVCLDMVVSEFGGRETGVLLMDSWCFTCLIGLCPI